MGTHLILSLWTLCLLSLVVILGTDLSRSGGVRRPAMRPTVGMLAVDALLLIGVGLGSLYGLQLPEESPRLYQVLQGALPLLLCLLGGVLAARWFVAGRRTQTAGALHSPAGWLALVLALGLVLVTGGAAGIFMDSAAVLTLLLIWPLAHKLGERGLQAVRLGAALGLLWAGAFLVYLMIFPAQVAVEATVEEGAAATAAAAPGDHLLLVAPLVLLTAFLLGFFKRQRG